MPYITNLIEDKTPPKDKEFITDIMTIVLAAKPNYSISDFLPPEALDAGKNGTGWKLTLKENKNHFHRTIPKNGKYHVQFCPNENLQTQNVVLDNIEILPVGFISDHIIGWLNFIDYSKKVKKKFNDFFFSKIEMESPVDFADEDVRLSAEMDLQQIEGTKLLLDNVQQLLESVNGVRQEFTDFKTEIETELKSKSKPVRILKRINTFLIDYFGGKAMDKLLEMGLNPEEVLQQYQMKLMLIYSSSKLLFHLIGKAIHVVKELKPGAE